MKPLKWNVILAISLALFGWSVASASVQAATLVLISLKCYEPEDGNSDEPELVVVTGGQTFSYRLRSMTRGDIFGTQHRPIKSIRMRGDVTLILYDRDNGRNDWFDSDDYLGAHTIRPLVQHERLHFTGDGAHYTLWYQVDPD